MKECPECHARYDDNMNFCTNDGTQLVTVKDVPNTAQLVSSSNNPQESEGTVKKIFSGIGSIFFVVIVCVIGFRTCFGNDSEKGIKKGSGATFLNYSPQEIKDVPKLGGEYIVRIESDGEWKVESFPKWIEMEQVASDGIKFVVRPIEAGLASRWDFIYITTGNLTEKVRVEQTGVCTFIKLSESSIIASEQGIERTVDWKSDGVRVTIDHPSFVTFKQVSGQKSVIFTISPNFGDYREGNIVFYEDECQSTIRVAQAGNCPSCHGIPVVRCTTCGGYGQVSNGYYNVTCSTCNGYGQLYCTACNKTGKKNPDAY